MIQTRRILHGIRKATRMSVFMVSLVVLSSAAFSQDSVKIMPLGDSITELDWQGGYRSYLYKLLSDSGFVFDYVGRRTLNHNDGSLGFAFPQAYWDHEGYSGRAIYPTWLDSVGRALRANPPQVIILMLGTNDVSNGTRSSVQIRNFMSQFLDSIWTFNPSIRVVLSNLPRIVPGSLFSQAKLDTIIKVNALWPGLVAEKKAAGRPLYDVDNFNVLTETSDFTGDGIHPSVAGYRKMRYVWYPAVVQAIRSVTSVDDRSEAVPTDIHLGPAYPNPFNPATRIDYALPTEGHVTLRVYDLLGREMSTLVDGVMLAGSHSAQWNAGGAASGVYLYSLSANGRTVTRSMMLTK